MHTISRLFVAIMLAILATGCASSESIRQRRALRMDQPVTMNGVETIEESIARLEVEPKDESARDRAIRLIALEKLYKQRDLHEASLKQKSETPVEREARLEYDKQVRASERKDHARTKAIIDTGLRCQNPDDEDLVWISGAVSRRWVASTHTSMLISNETSSWVKIRRVAGNGGPVVVEDLCPGGTINLQERLSPLDGYSVVGYSAIIQSDKGVRTLISPQIYMRKCTSIGCQYEFFGYWNIK